MCGHLSDHQDEGDGGRDFDSETEWANPPDDVDEDKLAAEVNELESELHDELNE